MSRGGKILGFKYAIQPSCCTSTDFFTVTHWTILHGSSPFGLTIVDESAFSTLKREKYGWWWVLIKNLIERLIFNGINNYR